MPPGKTRQALEFMAGRAGQNIGISVRNPLPAGRGYHTSMADIGAALFSGSQALQLNLTALEAAQTAAQIEPTASTFFAGLALFEHRTGRFFSCWAGRRRPGWSFWTRVAWWTAKSLVPMIGQSPRQKKPRNADALSNCCSKGKPPATCWRLGRPRS